MLMVLPCAKVKVKVIHIEAWAKKNGKLLLFAMQAATAMLEARGGATCLAPLTADAPYAHQR